MVNSNIKNLISWIRKAWQWLILLWSSFMIRLSIALYNSEELILKATGLPVGGKGKYTIRVRHRNALAEKLVQGQRDEKFVQDYYSVLKKADEFQRNVTPEKAEMVANKHGMSKRGKDKWGRRYDHYGFFDPSNKHYGKSVGEVLALEMEERRTQDDDFDLEIMFDNTPVVEGLSKTRPMSLKEQAKNARFPMKVVHNSDNYTNRIEQLTKFLHVKRVTDNEKVLEFFIPEKFKVLDLSENSTIFKEIIDIKQVWIFDEYGGRYGYSINDFRKRIKFNDSDKDDDAIVYDIIKFNAKKIENL